MSSCSTAVDGAAANPAREPDTDAPEGDGLELAQFAAGCFWSVELTYQRLPGVARTEVGYTQGHHQAPTYELVCGHGTGHAEAVRVHYDPRACPYATLLDVFWAKINPTTLNRQVCIRPIPSYRGHQHNTYVQVQAGHLDHLSSVDRQGKDVGTQYRTGIYYYTPEQESLARASLAEQQKKWEDKIVTEILPAKRFYPAEEYHQRYLEKGGQSAEKGCTEPMRCYG
jgi:peptide-methionine (S)-S-oxide reductase